MIITTMCYLRRHHQTLMLHRIIKENDINAGKWIGVGGKIENGESVEECMRREILEETGFQAHSLRLHGFVVFPGLYHGQDEGMFVYSCEDFSGVLHECNEGVLEWIDDDKIASLQMWEGDYHFFEWLNDHLFHSAKITYQDDHVLQYEEEAY